MGKQDVEQGTLSIIIPAYNEKKTILALIERVRKADTLGLKKEIVIVDDGSTDGTKEVLRKLNNIKVFFHESNKGKGAAIRTGLQHARGDIILIQDADLEYNPEDYTTLLQPIIKGNAQVVYGSRFSLKENFDKNMYYTHYMGNSFLTWLTNCLYSASLEDMETGYKAVKKEAITGIKLNSMRFEIEPELTAKILKKGIKIEQVPISFSARSFEEGKKINWKDGLVAAWTLLKYKFKE